MKSHLFPHIPFPRLLRACALVSWAGLIGLPSLASADVSEVLSYRYFNATPTVGETLKQALNRSTPIFSGGQRFWGHTSWHVTWDTRWTQQNGGRCTITTVRTRIKATVTLPQMVLNEADKRARFTRFESALHKHELQHVAIARNTAREIDLRLSRLPSHPTCYELERAANALGDDLIKAARQRNIAYDTTTGHGRTEGAWID